MRSKPWAHQQQEFDKFKDEPKRALFWSMRTGKSKAMIDLASYLYLQQRINAVLIIAPNGVHTNWIVNELPKHLWEGIQSRHLIWYSQQTTTTQIVALSSNNALNIFAVNSEALQVQRVQEGIAAFLRQNKGKVLLVVDESHQFKKISAVRTKVLRSIAKRCTHVRLLTGTPAMNSPLHLFAQFELLAPGALGFKTYGAFSARYAVFKQIRSSSGVNFPIVDYYQNLEELRDSISTWTSVVLREDVKDMPPLLLTKQLVHISDAQVKAYDAILKDILVLREDTLDEVEVEYHMLRLQQILSGFVFDGTRQVNVLEDKQTPRLTALLDMLQNAEPEAYIIWCRFHEEIRQVSKALQQVGIKVYEYHGRIPSSERHRTIQEFQKADTSSNAVVFLAQPQAAAHGLDLSRASTMIWYSHTWDATLREQAIERATKIGGAPISVVDFVGKHPRKISIDDRIMEALEVKQDLANSLTGNELKKVLCAGSL